MFFCFFSRFIFRGHSTREPASGHQLILSPINSYTFKPFLISQTIFKSEQWLVCKPPTAGRAGREREKESGKRDKASFCTAVRQMFVSKVLFNFSRRENFLLQSQLCVLTLIRCPFHPRVTAVARKRPRSFCQKCRWQVTPKQANILDPTKSEWADLCRYPGIVWEPIRKRAHTQLIREHSVTVVSAR